MSITGDQARPVDRLLGPVLAGAAILVQAPRLVLTFLAADRLAVGPNTEQILLSVAAIGTAVVLTGGGVYIATAALTAPRWRLPLAWRGHWSSPRPPALWRRRLRGAWPIRTCCQLYA